MLGPDFEPTQTRDGAIRISIPFTDNRVSFSENDEFTKAVRALDIDRLRGIRQLSLKALINSNADGTNSYDQLTGTRYEHVLSTAYYAVEIGRNLGLSEEELFKLRAGGLLHDRKMPAFGDPTQRLDPKRLDEEDHWDEDLPDSAWEYLTRYGATKKELREQLDNMIHGRGFYGSILNIADRISYVVGDLKQQNRPPLHPTQGDIYKDVVYDEKSGELFFKDPSRLRFFLWERAELFSRFYIDPQGQADDFVIASLIAPFYHPESTENDALTPHRLRQMTDRDLISYLAEKYGVDEESFYKGQEWKPKYVQTQTLDEALDVLDDLQADSTLRPLGIKVRKGFKPSTDLKVWDKLTMSPVPASDLFSYGMSPYIHELVKDSTGYLVIYTDIANQGITKLITSPRII